MQKTVLASAKANVPFDRLHQEQRVRILKALELITPRQVNWFGTIRGIRKVHLHFFRPDAGSEHEALRVYQAALGLVYTATRAKGARGRLSTHHLIVEMLRRQGRVTKWIKRPKTEEP